MTRVTDEEIASAKEVPILDIWNQLGLPPANPGHNISSPWREDSEPSLQVGGSKNIVFDHGTGEYLDTIALTQKVRDCSFPEAVNWVIGTTLDSSTAHAGGNGQRKGKATPKTLPEDIEETIESYHQVLRLDKKLQMLLLKRRGLSLDTARKFRVGFQCDSRYFSIPIRRADGKTVGLKLHRSDPSQLPKAKSLRGSVGDLFGADFLTDDASTVVITEGEFDAMAVTQSTGLKSVSSSAGAACIRKEWADLLDGHPVVLFVDEDKRGAECRGKWLEYIEPKVQAGEIPSVKIVRELPDGCKDATDLLLGCGETAVKAAVDGASALEIPPPSASSSEGTTRSKRREPQNPREAQRRGSQCRSSFL